ncbi:MAG: hypothetical protein JXA33_17105 [Anaerolineae bacterium]|nr:hypothetical protein [Anaerolineae bacterium]
MSKGEGNPIRVLVIYSVPAVCELLVAVLENAEGIQVVGSGASGTDAVRLTRRQRPDVLVLGLSSGIGAIHQIMREVPTPVILVTDNASSGNNNAPFPNDTPFLNGASFPNEASFPNDTSFPNDASSEHNAPDNTMDLTFEALRAGALTVIQLPALHQVSFRSDLTIYAELLQNVYLMAGVPVVRRWMCVSNESQCAGRLGRYSTIPAARAVEVVGIAASTGGPVALTEILGPQSADFSLPILVVQHVTRGFTSGLVEWLDAHTALHVKLAQDGELLQPGTVLLAPDDLHLRINRLGVVELCGAEPYKGLRPSANYLFHSLAQAYGPHALGIMLTGMGDDGVEGLSVLRQAGGMTVVQDEDSCVVCGMPCAALKRGAAMHILSLDEITTTLAREGAINEQ